VRTTGTATVLFTDLVGSTELRSRVGADLADELRRTHDGLLGAAVADHNGTLVKRLGDGIMATFGSAVDGVDAAVAIQQTIYQHNRSPLHEPLSLRIGLSTGDVVWEDDDCFGDAVIEASRLCGVAASGQVLAADVVRVLARQRGQVFRSFGELELKGIADPVAAAEVVWAPLAAEPTGTPMPELLAVGARLRFAGRREELEVAGAAWKKALTDGERQAVLLAGEPGIGKTRLAREVALQAHEQGALVLYGRCEEDLGAPYQPFVEALSFFLARSPVEGLSDKLGRYAGELARLCPVIEDLVPGLEPPLRADAETERYRLFEAVASWLCAASEPNGLVLVLDDAHWATRPTLVLLQHVLHAATSAKLLIIGTYRDTDLDRQNPLSGLLADLRRQPGVTRIALTGLDIEGVMHLVTDAAGHELDESGISLAEVVHAETEGNPFFVGEILRHLRETGAIFVRDGRWVSNMTAAELGIPEGIREVVGRRLDRLSETANAALSTASVVGRDFDLDLVCAAASLDEDEAVAGLDEALRARLIEEIGVGQYRFAHALVRSTLYEELRATRRARTHAKVAAMLEERRPDDTAALAHHFVQAGDIDKGVLYSQRAGQEAVVQLAHDRAVDYFRQALELTEGDPARAADSCRIRIGLGIAQREGGDGGFRTTLLAAAAEAQRLGLRDELVQAALLNTRGFWSMAGELDTERMAVAEAALQVIDPAATPERARLLAVLAAELMFSDEAERRQHLSDEAVRVARESGDRYALLEVLLMTVPTNYVPWRMDVVVPYARELLQLAQEVGDPLHLAKANLWSFIALMSSGNAEGANQLAIARTLTEELGQPSLRWLSTSWDCFYYLMTGDLEKAQELLESAFVLGEATGQPDAFTWYAGQLWVVLRERGELTSLLETVETETARHPGLPAWECVLGTIYVAAGRHDDARRLLFNHVMDGRLEVRGDVLWLASAGGLMDMAFHLGEVEAAQVLYRELLPYKDLTLHGGIAYLGCVERYLALGAAVDQRWDDAVGHGQAALAFEERLGCRTWWGVAAAELSRVLRSRGADGDAGWADDLERRALEVADQTGSVFVRRRVAGQIA
jgi:class 3 adenylate cyclase/tetratricopeptide (TPR) repeat protein